MPKHGTRKKPQARATKRQDTKSGRATKRRNTSKKRTKNPAFQDVSKRPTSRTQKKRKR